MTIEKIEIWDFKPPYRDGSYVMSHVVLYSGLGRLIAVTLADGTVGVGEVVFAPTSTEAERSQQVDLETARFAPLIGQSAQELMALADDVRQQGKMASGVAFGIETAYFDLLAKQQQRSVADCLGGMKAKDVANYFSISERSVERVRARMALSTTAKVVQLKLGVGSVRDDRDQIAAVLADLKPDQVFLADTNGGWSVDEALSVIADFDDPRLIWEEPCKTYDENIEVTERSGRPVMVDQCVGNEKAALRAADEGRAAAMCIKPAFLGGLTVAQRIRDRCAAKYVRMRIDGPWCGDIANAAILHLAVGAEPDLLISSCDLREPLMIEPDLQGAVHYKGRLSPPTDDGLGIQFRKALMGPPESVIS